MEFLGMLDKIDDILYTPIEALCEWITAPIDNIKATHVQKIDSKRKWNEMEIEAARNERAAALDIKMRETDFKLQKMIEEHQDARRDQLVEAMKNYQLTLAEATRDIGESIGNMSIELEDKAQAMVLDYTQKYIKIQDEAREKSRKEIEEIKELFPEGSETYNAFLNNIMQERSAMINTAQKFINDLNEDLRRLNSIIELAVTNSERRIDAFLSPMKISVNGMLEINGNGQKLLEK